MASSLKYIPTIKASHTIGELSREMLQNLSAQYLKLMMSEPPIVSNDKHRKWSEFFTTSYKNNGSGMVGITRAAISVT